MEEYRIISIEWIESLNTSLDSLPIENGLFGLVRESSKQI